VNAGEKLEAAVTKLELLRRDSTSDGWVGWKQYSPLRGWAFGVEDSFGENVMRVETHNVNDAELVEVLHRTVAPQLGFLIDALARLRADVGGGNPEVHYRHALALADAILGDDA
jgi:hypothetical protein